MRILYNGTYLMNGNDDYALSLLVQRNFNEGIVKQLPTDIKVARKFGEWGDANDPTNHQLHESGIVYIENNPYLLTVMTKGPAVQPLAHVISDISNIVYNKMKVIQTQP